MLILGDFREPTCNWSPPLTDNRPHLVIAAVGVDFKFLVEIRIIQHCVFGNYSLMASKSVFASSVHTIELFFLFLVSFMTGAR